MARSRPPIPETDPETDRDRDPAAERYDERASGAPPTPVARFDDPSPPPGYGARYDDAPRASDRPADESDPADRAAFRIGANLLTLVALVLGGWWLWRHVLAPALLGPG